MMKKLTLAVLCCLLCSSLFARKDGYKIKIEFEQDIPDNYIYLAHYFGKPLPTVYKTDSAKVINGHEAVLETKDSVLGGLYMVLYKNNSKRIEFLLNNGDRFNIKIGSDKPQDITFKHSPENSAYVKYEIFLEDYGKERNGLKDKLKMAKTKRDSQKIFDNDKKMATELTNHRKKVIHNNPNTLLAALLKTLIRPEIPKGPHYLPDGKTIDSNFDYHYFKNHYWDNFNFQDNRLIYAPVYASMLNKYFNHVIYQVPDSIEAAADNLLAKARGAKEVFKYSLYWITKNVEKSRVMGMDEAFVYLVENYYMKGDAFWLDSTQLAKYIDKAQRISPNVLGNPAPKLNLQNVWTLQDKPLYSVKSPYTVVIFWDPDCGHCQKEIPLLDSVYNQSLKAKGVTVYSIPIAGKLTHIQDFIKKDHISDWINVVDAHHNSNYKQNYDVYSTPQIYLLNKDKKIIGKGLDHSNILKVLNWYIDKKKNS